jgi:hypothetical protein
METGRTSFLVTSSLLVALYAQASGRPAVAAGALAAASFKAQTMLSFMRLFLRRVDRRAWLYLLGFGIVLLLASGEVTDLPRKISGFLRAVAEARAPGKVNDFTLSNRLGMWTGV